MYVTLIDKFAGYWCIYSFRNTKEVKLGLPDVRVTLKNHYGLIIYGHEYGQITCFLKEWPKCRSPVEN